MRDFFSVGENNFHEDPESTEFYHYQMFLEVCLQMNPGEGKDLKVLNLHNVQQKVKYAQN